MRSVTVLLAALVTIAGCSDGNNSSSAQTVTQAAEQTEESPRIGFELLEVQSPTTIRAWISTDIDAEAFEDLELPEGWLKNQPRETGECGPSSGRFLRSPDAEQQGDILEEEYFGFNWFHSATVVNPNVPVDDAGILSGAFVRKYHELTFDAGSCMLLLVSPQGDVYFRIGRDAGRTSDEPTIPNLWRLEEYTPTEPVVIELFDGNLVIRTDNQDAFQGPVDIPGFDPGPISLPAAPLELSLDLCEDPANMAVLTESPAWEALTASTQFNQELVQRMVSAPTEGPFYMVNLIKFRERAVYADGRETELTGREANALYSPVEFLAAIGAGPVFVTSVAQQIEGQDVIWDEVAIVEYPCPVAFFSMLTTPEFRQRSIHKDAGVELTYLLVSTLNSPSLPEAFEYPTPEFPATEDDPSFELIHVMDFRNVAQYQDDANEPHRTGDEAWAAYQAGSEEAALRIGSKLTAHFTVQGLLAGDDRSWDEVYIVQMPSMAGFQALLEDEDRLAVNYHRTAAISDSYSLVTYPLINGLSATDDSGAQGPLPVTDDGIGTLCNSDADCEGIGFCLSGGDGPGFCSRECGAGECGDAYLCCHSCSEAAAAVLPFTRSACLVEDATGPLTGAPLSCSCE